jgi:hypothetical protein
MPAPLRVGRPQPPWPTDSVAVQDRQVEWGARVKTVVVLGAIASFLFGCASGMRPTVSVFQPVPKDARIGLLSLRDCTLPSDHDCQGAGDIAAAVIGATLSKGGYEVIPLARPASPDQALSDDVAIEVAKTEGFEYVINGEVNDFYRIAPRTFRVDRASLAFRLLKASDGSVVASASALVEATSNLGTPEGHIRKLAKRLLQEMSKTR